MADEDEHTPLLRNGVHSPNSQHNHTPRGAQGVDDSIHHPRSWQDPHAQFCSLIGVPPSNLPANAPRPHLNPRSLYARALSRRKSSNLSYSFTAALANVLLLSQVVLGAALTGLGASQSSHVLITIFGALNTVIAGLITYLKSRGQPMRARMFRDDLDRIVDEIENSEVMWLGITKNVLGYDEIDTADQVSVRSEVARLTRMYERAVKYNTLNNPDSYFAGANLDGATPGMRGRQPSVAPKPGGGDSAAAAASGATAAPVGSGVAAEPIDESPATASKPNDIHQDTTAPSAAAADKKDPDDAPKPSDGAANAKVDGDQKPADGEASKDGENKNEENLPNGGKKDKKTTEDAKPDTKS